MVKECCEELIGGQIVECYECLIQSRRSCKHFGYERMSVNVPWCKEQDRRIIAGAGVWLCDECEGGD